MYKIVSSELLEPATSMFRFTLRRVVGQTPIRHEGKEARPTAQEKAELEAHLNLLAGTRPPKDKKRKRA
jgi:hypothetical protein